MLRHRAAGKAVELGRDAVTGVVACRRLAVFILLLVTTFLSLHAESSAFDLEQMEHRRWTAADGGPGQVGALAQSADGNLWVGSNDALYRFDGYRFVRHDTPTIGPLGTVSSLMAVQGGVWVGLRAGDIVWLPDNGEPRRFGKSAGLPGGAIYGFGRTDDDVVWAAADEGLVRLDGVRWQRVGRDAGFPGQYARALHVDRSGTLWVADEKRLFYRVRGAARFVDAGIPVDWASQFAQAPDGSLWVSERYGGALHHLVPGATGWSARRLPLGAAANDLLFDREGDLWVSTVGNGLLHLRQAASMPDVQPSRFDVRDGLSAAFIWPLLEDHDGNVWAGSSSGLDRFRPRTVRSGEFPSELLNVALAADAEGGLWAASGAGAPLYLKQGSLAAASTPSLPVTSAITDPGGIVWMGGPRGIWRADGDKLAFVTDLPDQVAPDSSVRAMSMDASGGLWVSINRVGMFVWRDATWTPVPSPSRLASQVMPVSASVDGHGRLWFGYRDNLLVTRDATGERHWGEADGLRVGHVTAMFHDAQRTWVGGQHGIAYFESGRFHALPLPDNGLFDNIYAILAVPVPQAAGGVDTDLWIHGRAGVFQLPASELTHAIADPAHTIRYRSHDVNGGLANDPYQVLPLPTAVRGRDGRLWFSTSAGIVWLDPLRGEPRRAAPVAAIESLLADGVPASLAGPPRLEPDTRRIAVRYTAPDLTAPEGLTFRYRLDGYDDTWQDVGRQREAVYTGLRAGRYTFRVMAFDRDGVASEPAAAAFVIEPMFYRQPWFLASVGAALLTLLWLLYRIRLRSSARQLRSRLETRFAERERIARELHDTLLQSVQGLVLKVQAAAEMIPKDQLARMHLEQALDRADEVMNEGRDRVRQLRHRGMDSVDLAQALRALHQEIEHRPGVDYGVTVVGQAVALEPAVCDEVYRIAREAVVNAFAHAEARSITVQIRYAATRLTLAVHDDGKGFDALHLCRYGKRNHWGLQGMRERAGEIDGVLVVRSQPGGPTEVVLDVPSTTAYRRGGSPSNQSGDASAPITD